MINNNFVEAFEELLINKSDESNESNESNDSDNNDNNDNNDNIIKNKFYPLRNQKNVKGWNY